MIQSQSYSRWVRYLPALGAAILCTLIGVGIFRAFTRGANDFAVFYEAWKLVLQGRGLEIYRVSPDRFLYAPGFAWLLAPLALLSKNTALAVWCVGKTAILMVMIWALGLHLNRKSGMHALGLGAWGVILVARPFLIDLEYGQVNLIILGACFWGLLGHFKKEDSVLEDAIRWMFLTFAAIAKLFPLPLLLMPWLITSGIPNRRLRIERISTLIGVLIILLIPATSVGFSGAFQLVLGWREAVLAKGLPLESHNQSFIALLYHYLSGHPTHILSEGGKALFLGPEILTENTILWVSLFWSCFTLGVSLGWIVAGSRHHYLKWIAIMIGLLIIPSHLVWKPYFVMSIPLAILLLHWVIEQKKRVYFFITFILFFLINFTGFDFVGHQWGSYFEAASILLVTHLTLLFWVGQISPQKKIA